MTAGIPQAVISNSELRSLLDEREFATRHIGYGDQDVSEMLGELGFVHMSEFIQTLVPASIYSDTPLNLPDAVSEVEALAQLKDIAGKNKTLKSLIGQGYYGTETPAVIQRNILENPAWYTAYTPYQPEISQGRLEAILNFQTMVSDLTGLDVSNASMLDEGTAAAEAMSMARRTAKNKSNCFFVHHDCFPQTINVVKTRAIAAGYEVVVGELNKAFDGRDYFGVLLQYPGVSGEIEDFSDIIEKVHAAHGKVVMAADILSLLVLRSPGELGADIAVGSTQRFGVPVGFGGPHAGYMATKSQLQRSLPGRLVGVSIDSDGKPAYRLALQTREQHIRREKATSNICTAQVLLAVIASMYACYHGPQGLLVIARRTHALTALLAAGLQSQGFEIINRQFFDTLTVRCEMGTDGIHRRAVDAGINLRHIDADTLGVSLDETIGSRELKILWAVFDPDAGVDMSMLAVSTDLNMAAELCRTDPVLQHPVFSQYQTETDMLRYLRRLSDSDLALDRTMIPLGSCTMKLNATSEMMPISWPEFSQIHPFVPLDQVAGYLEMIGEVEKMLIACTGYDRVSMQPNAGSQGEFAGLLAIRGYHESRGEGHRNICLIPSSAHGTNPASAQMCAMRVVVVNCDDQGNVDIDDLSGKAQQHAAHLAAIMVTYPSTHGVFESQIREIAGIVHQHGGQVYIDGANLNAMVGICAPGEFGGDVSHLNLHKTFCIPHGGGGPGVGPIAVKAHLAPFIPASPLHCEAHGRQVSSTVFGSASILPITWMYVRMMGSRGLRRATEAAILSANYLAKRLSEHYPILYTGNDGLVAHECILDIRPIKESTG
ncbi:MAG: aminomethyl-transferring glycine dehydrogenase, partial [Porticoccaceae bacterium]|nr:aminomethyl-transferring glycine dehydrogenase [Porticoccaceae bacterium]